VKRAPVAVFDSGVGGLSVLRHLRADLPGEDFIYMADTAWCPYGPKPAGAVRGRVFGAVDELVGRGAKEIVLACNTASTLALDELRERWPTVPFVGMEPAVKPAAARTDTGAIGVLATATTAAGAALARLVDRFGRGVAVHVAVPEGLVELVEAGRGDSPEAEALLRPILAEWRAARVDTVVLGCTHYPFACGAIERVAGPGVVVIDPAPAVARQAGRVLAERGLAAAANGAGRTAFLTTGEPAALRRIATGLVPAEWTAGAEYGRLVLR
jgi:glutamate racemase